MYKRFYVGGYRGFTIIEVMMAMVAFSLFTLTITMLLKSGLHTFNRGKILTDLHQEVKKSLSLVSIDVKCTDEPNSMYIDTGRQLEFATIRYARSVLDDDCNDGLVNGSLVSRGTYDVVGYSIVRSNADDCYELVRSCDDYNNMVVLEDVLLGETPSDEGTSSTYASYFKANRINGNFRYGTEAPYPTMEIRMRAGRYFGKDFLTCTMTTVCSTLNRQPVDYKPIRCTSFTHLIELDQPSSQRGFRHPSHLLQVDEVSHLQ